MRGWSPGRYSMTMYRFAGVENENKSLTTHGWSASSRIVFSSNTDLVHVSPRGVG